MLNKICTDLETSKKLKELGIEMETAFIYREFESTELKSRELVTETIFFPDDVKAYTLEQIILYAEALTINAHVDLEQIEGENMVTHFARNLIKLKEDKII